MSTAAKKQDSDIDLSTTLCGGRLLLETCIYNASGPRSGTVEALQKVAASAGAGAILSKSATLVAQDGNPLPRIHHDEQGYASFNSEGLPNQGIDYYINEENVTQILSAAGSGQKPYMVSLSGKTLEDNIVMLRKILLELSETARGKIAGIELNLACPNIIGKPTLAYDMEQLRDVLNRVQTEFGHLYNRNKDHGGNNTIDTLPPVFGVKLPPYLDMIQLAQVADILNAYAATENNGMLSYITTMNTMGNALAIDVSVQQPYISANQGLAGMSGKALKATALANVWKFRQCLLPSIDIVGVGGIETGEDVIKMLLAGAKAVQIGTVHWMEGPSCFDRIAEETRTWMAEHGYTSVMADVYNQLKPWSKERANESRLLAKMRKSKQTVTKPSFDHGEATTVVCSSEAQRWRLVSAVLMVIIALLIADKWHGNLLPSEAEL